MFFSNLFSKVLMASAATNALRLHQRIPAFQLNAQTFQNILAEDSGHVCNLNYGDHNSACTNNNDNGLG